MEIQALPTELTFASLYKPHADRHRPKVEIMCIFAIVPNLAEVS